MKMDIKIRKRIGDNIRVLRKRDNMSQEALAYDMDIPRSRLSAWEEYRSTPRADGLLMLSEYFGVTVDELISTTLPDRQTGLDLTKGEMLQVKGLR